MSLFDRFKQLFTDEIQKDKKTDDALLSESVKKSSLAEAVQGIMKSKSQEPADTSGTPKAPSTKRRNL